MGKTKSKTSKAGANAYNEASKLMKFAAEVKLMKNAAADTARQVLKNAPSERTKEMGGPNMETPLEGNAFTKAMADNDGNYEAAKKQLEGSGIKMISTAMPGVDPMTGMIQQNQFAPSSVNPKALGSLQNQIPNIAGTSVSGMYDRVMPQPGQTGLAAPLQHKTKDKHIHPTEFTGKIQTKKDGQEYSLIELDGSQKVQDTLKPSGLKFPKSLVNKEGYLKGSMDLSASKTGPKTFTLNKQ
jgi:hypothetical protein